MYIIPHINYKFSFIHKINSFASNYTRVYGTMDDPAIPQWIYTAQMNAFIRPASRCPLWEEIHI